MRRIALSKVLPGVILAKAVFSLDGRVLLNAGIKLKESYIQRLISSGITDIYIEDEISANIEINDILCEQTRLYARQQVKKMLKRHNLYAIHIVDEVKKLIDTIIDELFAYRDIIVNLVDIKSVDDYTFEHSVNVCVLSLIIGIGLGYNRYQLRELGIGAVLHDIGKLKIPEQLLKKPSQLTECEFDEIKKHTVYGYEILKRITGISAVSICIALMHHERIDGSGYPMQIKGEAIHECARIVAIADVYDALTSDRVYRSKLRPDEVVEYLTTVAVGQFDENIVELFKKYIAIYPPGTGVKLSTGEKGLVVSTNRGEPSKPVVRVIFDNFGNKLHNYYEINLTDDESLYVAETCDL